MSHKNHCESTKFIIFFRDERYITRQSDKNLSDHIIQSILSTRLIVSNNSKKIRIDENVTKEKGSQHTKKIKNRTVQEVEKKV